MPQTSKRSRHQVARTSEGIRAALLLSSLVLAPAFWAGMGWAIYAIAR